jgi:hypothetical protein
MPVLKLFNPTTQKWEASTGPTTQLTDAPGVRVYRSTTLSLSSGVTANITFSGADYDTNGFWAASAPGRLTIPAGQAGRYLVTTRGYVLMGGTQSRIVTYLKKNGSTISMSEDGGLLNAGGESVSVLSEAMYLAVGDYIEWDALSVSAAATFGHTSGYVQAMMTMTRLASGTPGPQGPVGTVATAAGITFPATQVASTDPYCLDDYREGYWTPAWVSTGGGAASSVTAAGRYVKRARWVKVSGSLIASPGTLGAGNLTISGLPFNTATDTGLSWYAGAIGYLNAFNVSNEIGLYTAGTGLNYLTFVNGASGPNTPVTVAAMSASSHIIFGCEYETAN